MDHPPVILAPPFPPKGNWRDHYESRCVTAEEAIARVRVNDLVSFSAGREPAALGLALAARAAELGDLTVYVPSPSRDFGWYNDHWKDLVSIQYTMALPIVDELANARIAENVAPGLMATREWPEDSRRPDVLLIEISDPDKNGFCSFGASVWDKHRQITEAKLVLAEVNPSLIRTCGENYCHVSEIDYFAQHTSTGSGPASVDLRGRKVGSFPPYAKPIGELVSTLIHDGDCLQIGVGTASEPVALFGGLEHKNDLGWHSEVMPRGLVPLIRAGNVNGSRKTIHRGVAVGTAVGGGSKEDMQFVDMNPMFALFRNDYVGHPSVIASNDNMVAINNALVVDLFGQIGAETVGNRICSSAGGQTAFAIGAHLSRGGRNITVLPSSTASGISRIVPSLAEGTVVTVPRGLADYVVTEYGIAHLRGRSARQRCEALIAIAHPDHRAELSREARKLFWPASGS